MDNFHLKLPITLICTIIEKHDTINQLDEYTIFKQNINISNENKNKVNGIVIINERYMRIENEFYIQNFPYQTIKEIKITNNNSKTWTIILINNENITLQFDSVENKKIEEYEKLINQKINNIQTNNTPINDNNQETKNMNHFSGKPNSNDSANVLKKFENFIRKEKLVTCILLITIIGGSLFIYSSTTPFTLERLDTETHYNTGAITPPTTTYAEIRINTLDPIKKVILDYYDSDGKPLGGLDSDDAWIDGNHIYIYGNTSFESKPTYCKIGIEHGSSYYTMNYTLNN